VKPLILVNFKTYETATADSAVSLAKICEAVATETGATIAVAVSALDLARVTDSVKIPVFAQHVDVAGLGSYTGQIPPELVKKIGATGTLLNHSENRCVADLSARVAAAKSAGLQTIVCAESTDEVTDFAALEPDAIAIEPPELIGGDISVTTADPEIITASLERSGGIPILVGAGVKNSTDTEKAEQLGASGVLLASGVTKAEGPAAVLRDLASGLSN